MTVHYSLLFTIYEHIEIMNSQYYLRFFRINSFPYNRCYGSSKERRNDKQP